MWVVTGATGFIGSNILRSFAESGVDVVGLSRRGPLCDGRRVVSSWDVGNLSRALEGASGIVHAAAVVHRPSTRASEYDQFNVDGTRVLLDASRAVGVGRFVFISSIKVNGEAPTGVINETTPIAADLDYARTKADAEKVVLGASDLNPVVLRLCPVYGVGDKGNVRTMIRAIWHRRFFIPGSGDVRKSIVHVSSVADVVRAATTARATGVFVVADAHTPSIRELADTIASLLGRRRPISVPAPWLAGVAKIVGDVARRARIRTAISPDIVRKAQTNSVCDPSRAVRELGVSCHVDLRETLREEIDWLRRDGLL